MRLIGYVRVSTEEQGDEGYGLAAQRDTMEFWSAARGHELLTVTTDVISAGKTDRLHGRSVAIAAIEMGVADGLLIRALDRGTRDQLDGAQLFKRAERYGWQLLDCDGTDSGDTSQRLTADVRLAMAAEERRKIGQRTREGLARARREGKQLGRPTLIRPDVERRIAILHREGLGPKAIATALTAEGIPTATGGDTWHYSTVRGVLARIRKAVA
ncbi:recombinase family protein [Nocardia neocaledoniensis]|uniref:recombinase family protein n=1 Tax=Nocardia neocaledoniensis TaxID=236511 RepID=UPI00245873B2|nr:recombinase family protein [Nocardia neocaledoniensis]